MGGGQQVETNIVIHAGWMLGLGLENDPTARRPDTPKQAEGSLLWSEPLLLTGTHLAHRHAPCSPQPQEPHSTCRQASVGRGPSCFAL